MGRCEVLEPTASNPFGFKKSIFFLPLGNSDQGQASIVPRYLSKEGEQKQQPLQVQSILQNPHCTTKEPASRSSGPTHQEANEVEDEDGGHPAEGQALQHWAAGLGRVTVVLEVDGGYRAQAALWCGALGLLGGAHHATQQEVHRQVELNAMWQWVRTGQCWCVLQGNPQ